MYSARVAHRPPPGISREQARDARARAWTYVFDVWNSKKATRPAPEPSGRDDAKESKHGVATANVTR